MMPTILIAAVTMKNTPIINATLLSLFRFITRFVSPWYGDVSSAVTSKIMDIKANQRLMSQKVNGNCIICSSCL